jgi:hypothetical protein
MHDIDLNTYAKWFYKIRLERDNEQKQMLHVTVESKIQFDFSSKVSGFPRGLSFRYKKLIQTFI